MSRVYPKDLYYIDNAIRLHFKQESFDAFKYHMRVKSITHEKFEQNRNFRTYVGWARKLTDRNIHPIEFVLSNVLAGEGHISQFDISNWELWRKRLESLTYNAISEINSMMQYYSIDVFSEMFNITNVNSDYPPVVEQYLEKKISLETITIINMFVSFTEQLEIQSLGWDDIRLNIKKYEPFLRRVINTEKVKRALLKSYKEQQ